MENNFLKTFDTFIDSQKLSSINKKNIKEFTYNLFITTQMSKIDNSLDGLRENLKQLISNPPDISVEMKIKYLDYLLSTLEKK